MIVQHLGENTAYFRACHEKDWHWDNSAMLQAATVDALNVLIWMKTEDGHKGRNRPKPVPRPGVVDDSVRTFGKGSVSADVLAEMFGYDLDSIIGK